FVLINDLRFDFLTVKLPFNYFFADEFLSSEDKAKGVSVFNFTDEIAVIGSIVGLLLIAFSKVKVEDEYVSQIRLESLQWAIYLNFALLIIATLLVYGLAYYMVAIYNMVTPLLFFVIRFHYILFFKNSEKGAEHHPIRTTEL
ncbi:MAG: hypothetical protein ACK4YV_03405, partial [Emticicia sp.]